MPNPKRKHTRSRRDSRRSANWRLERAAMSPCPNPECKRLRRPHVVCPHCGFYNGRIAVPPKRKKSEAGAGSGEGESKS